MTRFSDTVALITGAGSGIGAATALRMAGEGARVFVADIDAAAAQRTVDEITGAGGIAHAIGLDVGEESSWAAAIDAIDSTAGSLNFVVNNAGITGRMNGFATEDLRNWETVIRVNQTGPMLGLKSALRLLRTTTGSRAVVNLSSVSAITGRGGNIPAYAASKGAVRALTMNTAIALAEEGIRVNTILPGVTRTAILADTDDEIVDMMSSSVPMGRLADPHEIAAAITFLLSDDASYITGTELVVDGGLTAY